MKRFLLLLSLAFIVAGCFMEAGTHGSIKGYKYPVKKSDLQSAVMKVINTSPNIFRDTSLDSLGSSPLLDHRSSDTLADYAAGENFYNDIEHYVTITITSGEEKNEYTFRYYGPDESWADSDSSELFICYAYDKERNGGSEGNGIKKRYAKELTALFEKEFISKVDAELGTGHIDTD